MTRAADEITGRRPTNAGLFDYARRGQAFLIDPDRHRTRLVFLPTASRPSAVIP